MIFRICAKDNHGVSIPASNVSYIGIGTDSVHGVLNWAIPANATGEHILFITLNDSICSKTPYLFDHNYLLRIHITHTWHKYGLRYQYLPRAKPTPSCQKTSVIIPP
ncbi:MAG: hypothetical protein R2831_02945 [Chitinophagaceae bacterium]